LIIDTHVHVIAGDESRHPLRPSGVGSEWFREHPVTAEEYLATATAAGGKRSRLMTSSSNSSMHSSNTVSSSESSISDMRISFRD